MELHRLKPMVENYDVSLFNELYSKTESLRRKLSSEINPHRFGLTSDDILSWFDDKFIYAFNKYSLVHGKEVLLGHIINALSFMKCRILRAAYTQKYSQQIINLENPATISDQFIEEGNTASFYYEKLERYMKSILSDNAFYLLQIQLNPPPYIMHRLNPGADSKKLDKISNELVMEYFDIPINKKTLKYILGLKEEIKKGIELAKRHFR